MSEKEPKRKASDEEREVSVDQPGDLAAGTVEEMVVDSDQPSHVSHYPTNDLASPAKTQMDDHIVQIKAGKAEVRLHECLVAHNTVCLWMVCSISLVLIVLVFDIINCEVKIKIFLNPSLHVYPKHSLLKNLN